MRVVTSFILAILVFVPIQSAATTHRVDMLNFVFDPESLTVNQGDTVLWVDVEGTHTTTSGVDGVPDGYWDSDLLSPGDSFAFVFDSLGTFPYYCTPHWPLGMVGVIIVTPVGIEETGSNIPTQFNISQNYPNPFNSSTIIQYELNTPAMTKLAIYNASGQSVKTLVKQYRVPGKYSVRWYGTNDKGQRVSNGVYFYELKVGSDIIHRKMMIIR